MAAGDDYGGMDGLLGGPGGAQPDISVSNNAASAMQNEFCETIISPQSDGEGDVNDGNSEDQSGDVTNTNDGSTTEEKKESAKKSVLPPLLFPSEIISEGTFSAIRKKYIVDAQNFYGIGHTIVEGTSAGLKRNIFGLTYEDEEWGGNRERFKSPTNFLKKFPESIRDSIDIFRFISGKFWYMNNNGQKHIKMWNSTKTGENQNKHVYHYIEQKHTPAYDGSAMGCKFNIIVNGAMGLSKTWDLRGSSTTILNYMPTMYFFGKDYTGNVLSDHYSAQLYSDPPIINFGKRYYDFYHSTVLPFYGSEVKKLTYGNSTFVDIKVETNYVNAKSKKRAENQIKSLYDVYQLMIDSDEKEDNMTSIKNPSIFRNGDSKSFKYKLFTSEHVKQFEKIKKDAIFHFPQYVEFDISTTQGSAFAQLFSETKMDKHVAQLIMQNTEENKFYRPIIANEVIDETQQSKNSSSNPKLWDPQRNGENDRSLEVNSLIDTWDISEFFMSEIEEANQDYFPLDLNPDSSKASKFWDAINKAIFIGKLQKQTIPEKIRTYMDIYNGKEAYAETIAYKIEKYKVDDSGVVSDPEPLQCFVMFDNEDIENFTFCDTQVSYGKTYRYRIFAINLVVGSSYEYEILDPAGTKKLAPFMLNGSQRFSPTLRGNTFPEYRIIKVPYFETEATARDKPPIFPDLSFHPYKNQTDKIGIMVNTNSGEYMLEPVQILDEDLKTLQEMAKVTPPDEDGKIPYKSDSPPSHFELFRLEEPPQTYEDFKLASRKKIIYPFKEIRGVKVDKTIFPGRGIIHIDRIEPNKFYYYCARSIDSAGISNPTQVFKLRLVSYEHGTFLDIKEHKLNQRAKKKKETFSRYLEISPEKLQRIYKLFDNEEQIDPRSLYLSVPKQELKLGIAEKSIWDKKYKLRIKSKQTGKIMDINFKFRYNIKDITQSPDETQGNSEAIENKNSKNSENNGTMNSSGTSSKYK